MESEKLRNACRKPDGVARHNGQDDVRGSPYGNDQRRIEPGANAGEWKAKMAKQMKGNREVGVVTIVINGNKLFVKTVEWEDL
jgi:ribosomal protein L39E